MNRSLLIWAISFVLTLTSVHAIDSVTPSQGGVGQEITIAGEGFGTGRPLVYFLETNPTGRRARRLPLRVLSHSDTELVVQLVRGLAGEFDLVIRTRTRPAQTLTREAAFEVLGPAIDSVSPKQGGVGDEITITGERFGTRRPRVYFQESNPTGRRARRLPARVLSHSDTELVVQLRRGLAGEFDLVIRAIPFEVVEEAAFEVLGPEIGSVTEEAEPNGTITILGTNFGDRRPTVTIGGLRARVTDFGDTFIDATVPRRLANGIYDVSVRNRIGTDTLAGSFTVINSTVGVSTRKSLQVTIDGRRLRIGNVPYLTATTNSVNALIINAVVPARPGGTLKTLTMAMELNIDTVDLPAVCSSDDDDYRATINYQEQVLAVPAPPTDAWFSDGDVVEWTIVVNSFVSDIVSGTFSGTLRKSTDESPLELTNGTFNIPITR